MVRACVDRCVHAVCARAAMLCCGISSSRQSREWADISVRSVDRHFPSRPEATRLGVLLANVDLQGAE